MKNNINKIFVLIVSLLCLSTSAMVAGPSDNKPNINLTSKAPSANVVKDQSSFLRDEKRINVVSPLAKSMRMITPEGTRKTSWDAPNFEQWNSGAGNVGGADGPIGDVTFPMIISIFLLYMVYRSVSTTRRKNDI